MGEFGEFEEVKDEVSGVEQTPEQIQSRAKLPRGNEKIGVIVQRYGGNRMEVKTSDGKSRNCRVPGRFKRDFWLRPKDVVIILPWADDDDKGDIVFKYNSSQISQLRKKGLLDFTNDVF